MSLFEYPLDTKILLRKKRKIRQSLFSSNNNFIEKRIAVLGGSTTNEIVDQLELFLLNYGIKPTFYQSEYGQYWQDGMFGNEELDSFHPDIIFIHTSWRNITSFPSVTSSPEEIDELLSQTFYHFSSLWDKISEKYACPIIQNNFDRPNWRLLGNKDVYDIHGKTNFIFRLNQMMYQYAQQHNSFYVNDIDYLSACYGLDEWSNPLYWHMYKYSLCLDAIPSLAKSVSDIIKSIYGKNKKVLVCDLDNTLWGGVVGDDGVEGIQVGPEVPMGQIYSEFQKYITELKTIGILLTINSKNDIDNALAGLKHPDCILKPDDFVNIKANWDNKDINMRFIAAELNLGIDSFVFVDDNPAERSIIENANLGISVPVMDQVENYIRNLDKNGYFEVTTLSDDDFARSEMYKANAMRSQLKQNIADYDDFLESLEMKATIKSFEPIYVQRIAQLTNKSNQFNLTTLRCSEDDILYMKDSPDYLTLYGKLEDKFGDNGVVSVVVGEKSGNQLHIKLWLMSCRVLKRGMEDAMLNSLADVSIDAGIDCLIGYYYPTAKNKMVCDFYSRMGFKKISEDTSKNTVWSLDLKKFKHKKTHITIEQ